MALLKTFRLACAGSALALACLPQARAAERVTLRNGFAFDCVRREAQPNDIVRLYFDSPQAAPANYLDVSAASVVRVETIPDLPAHVSGATVSSPAAAPQLTAAALHEMIARSGAQHNVDSELLASVVHAESAGQVRAVSRTGARGLMQLMPGTASEMGVRDSFVPDENVEGGTRYLDTLLTRYHDNIALALAAYNAGPAAVDRYRGVPPFRETRAYVARVIREFNHRKTVLLARGQ